MKEYGTVVLWLVLGLVGFVAFGSIYRQAPGAGVPVNYDLAAAKDAAFNLLEELGHNPSRFEIVGRYDVHEDSSGYIQRELAKDEAKATIERVGVQHWDVRFFKPPQTEQIEVSVNPVDGTIFSIDHRLEEEGKGASIDRGTALEKAQSFVIAQGHRVGSLFELVEESSIDRANRRDHTFTWRHISDRVADAPFEVEVTVTGDMISNYSANLNIPDSYTQAHQTEKNRGVVLSFVSFAFLLILFIFAIVYGLRYYKQDLFSSRIALYAGGIVALAGIIEALNVIEFLKWQLPTSAPTGMILVLVGATMVGALVAGGLTVLFTGAGIRLAHDEAMPASLELLPSALSSSESRRFVIDSLVRGTGLAGILLAVIQGGLWLGHEYLGVWSPGPSQEINIAYLSIVPALFALTIGASAAIWEEAAFRLFGIPLTKRFLRSAIVAVVVTGVMFGLAHTTYSIFPIYTRAIEAGAIGVLMGLVFLRYGVLTTMTWHFVYNSSLVAAVLLPAEAARLAANGIVAAVIAALPLLAAVALIVYDNRVRESVP